MRQVIIIFSMFLVAFISLVVNELWHTILYYMEIAIVILFWLAILAAIVAIWRVADWLLDMVANSRHDRALKAIELEAARASAIVALKATANEQLFLLDNGNWQNITMPDPELWHFWQQYHATSKKLPANVQPQIEIEKPKPDFFPVLLDADRLCLAGTSDSGKTTVAKLLIAHRASHGRKQLIISPHETAELLPGLPVAGIGRNYSDIALVLQALIDLMSLRYQDVATGRYEHFQHSGIDITIDEWTSIQKQIDNAGDMLGTLLTESRKVNMRVTILSHSLNVDTLGVNRNIRQNMILAWLEGGNGKPHTAKRLEYGLTGKQTITEYNHPGSMPLLAIPDDSFIVDIPSSQIIKSQVLSNQGMSDTAIARQIFGVRQANARHINQVIEWRTNGV